MSVPKSERRQSAVEYIVLLQNISHFYYQALLKDREAGIYIPNPLIDRIYRKSLDVYSDATLYFEMTIGKMKGGNAEKKRACTKIYYGAKELAALINLQVCARMDIGKPTKGLLNKTQELLKVTQLMEIEINRY